MACHGICLFEPYKRALINYLTTRFSGTRAHIDNMIGNGNYIWVMFNYEDTISLIPQASE
ncbi:hypothetical protein D3X10_13615 [Shewanella algae]|nr:hypothetical protein DD549_19540 [Shewanella algae]UYA16789.1 hypothetical protein D3X10_13615 [Shewanella algae]